jgi:hypothetical protein
MKMAQGSGVAERASFVIINTLEPSYTCETSQDLVTSSCTTLEEKQKGAQAFESLPLLHGLSLQPSSV